MRVLLTPPGNGTLLPTPKGATIFSKRNAVPQFHREFRDISLSSKQTLQVRQIQRKFNIMDAGQRTTN